jgi:hypothetical protein
MIRRLYDPANIPKLIQYGKRWHPRSALKDLPFDAKRCDQLLRGAFISPDMAVWASFDQKKHVRGVLIGAICAYPFFDAKYATDITFIADHDGAALFRSFYQWAKSHGANALQMGVTSGLSEAEPFYLSVGLEKIGGIYYMQL